jgi:hypothetical protein
MGRFRMNEREKYPIYINREQKDNITLEFEKTRRFLNFYTYKMLSAISSVHVIQPHAICSVFTVRFPGAGKQAYIP